MIENPAALSAPLRGKDTASFASPVAWILYLDVDEALPACDQSLISVRPAVGQQMLKVRQRVAMFVALLDRKSVV